MMLSYENNFKSKREDGRFTSHLAAHNENPVELDSTGFLSEIKTYLSQMLAISFPITSAMR